MSQDKRKLFGSRISSIFSSNDSHHHLKTSEKNISHNPSSSKALINSELVKPRSTSHLQQPGNVNPKVPAHKNISVPSHGQDFTQSKTESRHFPLQSKQTNQSPNSQFSRISRERDVREISSSETHTTPRAKPQRKPPPDASITSETKPISSHLSDVIDNLEREIDNMAVEKDNYSKTFTQNRPNLSHLPSSDQTFPLKINRSPQQQGPRIESAPLSLDRQDSLHSSIKSKMGPVLEKPLNPTEKNFHVQNISETPLNLENAVINKELSPGVSSFEQSASSPEYNTDSSSARRDFMFQDQDYYNSNLTESSTFPQGINLQNSDSDNAVTYQSRKGHTSSGSNDSAHKDEEPYTQNSGSLNHQVMSDLDSSNGAGSGFLSNWDEIVDSTSESNPGEFFETHRLYKPSDLTFASNLGFISESIQPILKLPLQPRTHARMLSISSVYSAGSTRHVSLATLKMTFNLRPGEGEKSNYVETLRKGAGTSFNEAGPGKWKLPTGIVPVDKRDIMKQATKKFSRGVNSAAYRTKKSSGVELKHGHLKPRLLAAEVDEGDSTNKFGSLGRSSTLQNKAITPVTSKSSTPSAGLKGISRANSLERANTLASISTAGDVQSSLSKISNSRRASTISSADSVGSVSNDRNVDIYYQHQGFKFENGEDSLENDDYYNRDRENLSQESEDSEDEKPRLYLANPDSDSD